MQNAFKSLDIRILMHPVSRIPVVSGTSMQCVISGHPDTWIYLVSLTGSRFIGLASVVFLKQDVSGTSDPAHLAPDASGTLRSGLFETYQMHLDTSSYGITL